MEEATQLGADSQSEVNEADQDFASRMANMLDGAPPSDEGSEGAVVEGEQPVAEEADSQAEVATPEAEEEPTFTIKVDGEERVLTQSELIAEAQKAQAANKRFEEAAQLRKQFDAEKQQITQQVSQEREMLQQALNHYSSQLQTLMQQGQPDWQALLQNDPIEYLRLKEVFSQRQAELQQARAAEAYLKQQQDAEAQEKKKAQAAENVQRLLEAIPDWADPSKFMAEKPVLEKFLGQRGYTDQEMSSLDFKTVVMARELHQLKTQLAKQTDKQAQALKKVEKLPPKVEKTGTGVRPADGRTAGMQRLSKTGRPEDAAAVIANFL